MSEESKSLVPAGRGELSRVTCAPNPLVARGLGEVHETVARDAQYFYFRGLGYFDGGDFRNAMKDFDDAIRLNPQFAKPYELRGKIWRAWGMHGKANKDIGDAIRLDPNNARLYYERWTTYDRGRSSVADLDKAVDIDPDFTDAFIERGIFWAGGGYRTPWADLDKAISDFNRAINIDSNNARALDWLVRCCSWKDSEQRIEAPTVVNNTVG